MALGLGENGLGGAAVKKQGGGIGQRPYIYIYVFIHNHIINNNDDHGVTREAGESSKSNFATRFLPEIPLKGFPFRMEFSKKCRILKNNTNLIAQRISFEKEIPSGGFQAGNISQTSRPKSSEEPSPRFGSSHLATRVLGPMGTDYLSYPQL